jgi:hypothetical protein
VHQVPGARLGAADEAVAQALDAGDLAAQALQAWVNLVAGEDLLLRESLARRLEALRRELLTPEASPLERILVGRVIACHLQAEYADALAAQTRSGGPAVQRLHLDRQNSAQRRLLAAAKALVLCRRLLPAAAPVVVHAGGGDGRPDDALPVRRAGATGGRRRARGCGGVGPGRAGRAAAGRGRSAARGRGPRRPAEGGAPPVRWRKVDAIDPAPGLREEVGRLLAGEAPGQSLPAAAADAFREATRRWRTHDCFGPWRRSAAAQVDAA